MKPSLVDLPLGQHAKIVSIDCERRLSRRLMEMGLLPGTRVRLVRVAPFGDPVELRVRNYSLSLRRAEAAKIAVRPEGEA
ncbi:MAG: FeoA family protein [Polyangiales bacterium]|jgi:Fe2+ transport system protein FeoA